MAGGVLIAGVSIAIAAWYVPQVIANNASMLTGTVTSSGIVALNFQHSGVISVMKVQPDESVHKGQVLALQYAPDTGAKVTADNAAISAVQDKITELKTNEAMFPANTSEDQAQIASEAAQLATDQAQLLTDRMQVSAAEIVAPAAGVIIAANGQPGEEVTPSGIRNYTPQQAERVQQPQFSLLPEGPQSINRASKSGMSLPVISLRVSSTWEVIALIPENLVHSIKAGQAVTVSVPAAQFKNVPGRIQQILPDPVTSSSGPEYQAVISITGTVSSPPLDGMAADIELLR